MHLALQLVQLLPQAVSSDGVVLRDCFVEPCHGGVGIGFQGSNSRFQSRNCSAGTLAGFEDGVGGERCGSGRGVGAGEEPHDGFDAVGGEGGFE
jgi:hypothetical protein